MTNLQITSLKEYRKSRSQRPNDREMWRVWRWTLAFLVTYIVTLKLTGVL